MGIKDLNKKYEINEIVSGDSIFVATGITDGDLTKGIKINKNKFISQTFITHKSSNTKEIRMNESEIF
jgi:fructose-1,6-bisphosphatase II / sedoheptulose-1,7-bisphosphatase